MEFLTSPSPSVPEAKNLYPCLATITVHPPAASTDRSRRLSTGSYGSNDGDDGNGLRRIISGGRRMSSSGEPAAGGGRRLSFAPSAAATHNNAPAVAGGDDRNHGTWYWRVQAGVVDTHLVLKPLTQPANPVLTSPPAPLSHAMPSHASHAAGGTLTEGGTATKDEDDSGLVGKMKKLFRRESSTNVATGTGVGAGAKHSEQLSQPSSPTTATTTTHTNPPPGDIQEEQVLDQTAQGEMRPSARGNAIGATNLNANAETGWPGVINGEKLGAIVVALGGIDKSKVVLGGGKKGEGSFVIVPITSAFSHFVHPMLEGGGKGDAFPKSGSIKFEFDKDWIGAKGEAELLHHYITNAISSLPERAAPEPANFQLGSGPGHHNAQGNANAQMFNEPFAAEHGHTRVSGAHALGSDAARTEGSGDSASGKVGGD